MAQQQQTTGVAREALQPQVASVISQFKTAVANATSIQSALLNPSVQQVLLTANGLSSYSGETALVQKILLSDPSDSSSLVNQLSNPTWLSTVQTYNFGKNGLAELQNPQIISTLTNAYAEVEWRQGLDQATPGPVERADLSSARRVRSPRRTTCSAMTRISRSSPRRWAFHRTSCSRTSRRRRTPSRSHLNIPKLQNRNYVTSLTDQYLLTMQENKCVEQ